MPRKKSIQLSDNDDDNEIVKVNDEIHIPEFEENIIEIQGILSQPMIVLGTGVGELTLLTKTQMATGV